MNTPASVARAATLDSNNSQYQAWLAERIENQGEDSSGALEAAARSNPYDSRVWTRRGLNAELRGEISDAERFLLNAAAIDRLMEPRWTLMNFYFRRGNREQFWRWANATFAIAYGDRRPMLELCWRMNPDESWTPPDPEARKQWLLFLMGRGEIDAAATLAKSTSINDPAVLDSLVDRLIDRNEAERAVQIWNRIHMRIGRLTNPDFAVFPSSVGFDWRISTDPGIAVMVGDGLRIALSGNQPDSCRLLSQTVPLEANKRYRLRFSFRTVGASGIRAYIADQTSPDLASEDWRNQTVEFSSGPLVLASLSFEYHRPRGYVRMEGSLSLKGFSLEPAG